MPDIVSYSVMSVPFWPYLPSTEVCREGSQSDNDITLLHCGSCTGFESCIVSFCQCSVSQGFHSDSIPNPLIFCEELESNIVILFLRFYCDGFLSIPCALCGVRQGFSPTSVSILLVFLKGFHSCDPSERVSLHHPKLCVSGVSAPSTLRASLSGTFLQTPSIAFRHLPPTLPDLVTPLKGHSLSLRSCTPTRSAPSITMVLNVNRNHKAY